MYQLRGIKAVAQYLAGDDSASSDDEVSSTKTPMSTHEPGRSPLDRHAFLFRQDPRNSSADLHELHPLVSQIPYLLDVFEENINQLFRIVHMPTVAHMVREARASRMKKVAPSDEALLFAIYYTAVTSLEEDDVCPSQCHHLTLQLTISVGDEQLQHGKGRACCKVSRWLRASTCQGRLPRFAEPDSGPSICTVSLASATPRLSEICLDDDRIAHPHG
jgi:hypothetical protein